MTPCHAEKYAEALEGMARLMPRMAQAWGRDVAVQPWMRAAMEQHAHYYASQACGETDMRMSRYGAMAALGITRVGDDNGVVRQISMAGFRGFGALHTSPVYSRTCTPGPTGTNTPWEDYCNCMFGQGTQDSKNCVASGATRLFKPNEEPWTCLARIRMLNDYGLNSFIDPAELQKCAAEADKDAAATQELLGKVVSFVKENKETIVQTGREAYNTVTGGPNTGTGTGVVSTPGTGSSSLPGADTLTALIKRPGLSTIGSRFGPSVPSLTPAPKSNTALYVGLGVAGVAVLGAILLTRKRGA